MVSTDLRLLVACGGCKSQFDATGLAAASRFHCSCGELVEVPAAKPHDAAVVRCSSCGAPRRAGDAACGHCNSDFTLREQDLHTLCPGCWTRISDRSTFCHSCGLIIAPQGEVGETTERPCPSCKPEQFLTRRELAGIGVLECPGCAGLWLGSEVFHSLEERAKNRASPWQPGRLSGRSNVPLAAGSKADGSVTGAVAYRACVECGTLMHRQNYARKSGVLIDVCSSHGVWFDTDELERILAWIRAGGLERTRQLEDEDRRQARRSQAGNGFDGVGAGGAWVGGGAFGGGSRSGGSGWSRADWLSTVLEGLYTFLK